MGREGGRGGVGEGSREGLSLAIVIRFYFIVYSSGLVYMYLYCIGFTEGFHTWPFIMLTE